MRNMEHLQAGRRERIGVYKQMFCGAGAVVVREAFFREIGERLAYVKKKW